MVVHRLLNKAASDTAPGAWQTAQDFADTHAEPGTERHRYFLGYWAGYASHAERYPDAIFVEQTLNRIATRIRNRCSDTRNTAIRCRAGRTHIPTELEAIAAQLEDIASEVSDLGRLMARPRPAHGVQL